MSNITIEVDFLAGTEFDEAAKEAKALARRMDVAYVRYNFNGVKCSIGQNASVESARQAYDAGKKYITEA